MIDAFRHIDAADIPPLEVPPKPLITTVMALSIGDYSTAPALCAVRYDSELVAPGDPLCGDLPIFETRYAVLDIKRLDLGLSWPAVAGYVNRIARKLYDRDSRGDYHLLVDASGVGRPVVSAIRDSIIPHVSVTAVTVASSDAGDDSILWRGESTVGLTYLVSRLRAITEGGRLQIPASSHMAELVESLTDYQPETESGPNLVRALALACASEYAPVRYDLPLDLLPSAEL